MIGAQKRLRTYLIKCSYKIYFLSLTENETYYDTKVNRKLLIQNPRGSSSWTVTFIPEEKTEQELLTREGNLVTEDEGIPPYFDRRIQVVHDGIEIDPVKITDSGTYEFRDPRGNLAQTVQVEVETGERQHILFFMEVKMYEQTVANDSN